MATPATIITLAMQCFASYCNACASNVFYTWHGYSFTPCRQFILFAGVNVQRLHCDREKYSAWKHDAIANFLCKITADKFKLVKSLVILIRLHCKRDNHARCDILRPRLHGSVQKRCEIGMNKPCIYTRFGKSTLNQFLLSGTKWVHLCK